METEESVAKEKEGCRIATKELDCPQLLGDYYILSLQRHREKEIRQECIFVRIESLS